MSELSSDRKATILEEIAKSPDNINYTQIGKKHGAHRTTVRKLHLDWLTGRDRREVIAKHTKPYMKTLYVDTEVLPNKGYFYDTYNDKRPIPLDFVLQQKAIITIQYAFNDDEPTVLIADEPYNDKDILAQFQPITELADQIIWHNGESFDRKILDARLFINKLPPLPPVQSIDTYKLAKAKFGRMLNSNGLAHLAKLCGVEDKGHVDARTWAMVAEGDRDALMDKVVPYAAQDVVTLRQIYKCLAPRIDTKTNHNLHTDSPVLLCKSCGSDDMRYVGLEYTAATFRHKYHCNNCMKYSTFPKTAKKP